MSVIEFVGFLISVGALIFLFCKQIYDELYRNRNPKKAALLEDKKHEQMRKFLHSLKLKEEDDKASLQSPKKRINKEVSPQKQVDLSRRHALEKQAQAEKLRAIAHREKQEAIQFLETSHDEEYSLQNKQASSRASLMVEELSSPRKMFLFKEIVGKPLALRSFSEEYL